MTCSLGNTNHNHQPIPVPSEPKKRFKLNELLQGRRVLIVTSVLAILLLVWLAAGIGKMSFAPGRPINFGDGEVRTIQESIGEIAREFSEVPFGQQVLFVGAFLAITAISLILMPAEIRVRLLRTLFRMGVTAFALLYFFNNFQFEGEANFSEELVSPLESIEALEGTDLTVEVLSAPQAAPAWDYVITFGLIILIMALGWWLSRRLAKPSESDSGALREIARIAKTSRDDLSAGAALEDVIIRSYMEMGDVVRDRRGIQRQQAMTPGEFAMRLGQAGLPAKPVERLTALFERVRYGAHAAGQSEVEEAVACLDAIAACFEGGV
ncbi:MAG: DUF4129 domain-containing protein [Chloroflexota bacterium]